MPAQGRKALPPTRDADITDAFSLNWRRWLCCLQRAGVIRKTRRRFHKMVRRQGKQEIRECQ